MLNQMCEHIFLYVISTNNFLNKGKQCFFVVASDKFYAKTNKMEISQNLLGENPQCVSG